jgi:hypothetical protein
MVLKFREKVFFLTFLSYIVSGFLKASRSNTKTQAVYKYKGYVQDNAGVKKKGLVPDKKSLEMTH